MFQTEEGDLNELRMTKMDTRKNWKTRSRFTCGKCLRRYRSIVKINAQVVNFEKTVKENSTLIRAVYRACTAIYNDGTVDIYMRAAMNPIIKDYVVDSMVMNHKLSCGWACKPKRADSIVIIVVGNYGERIKYWFDIDTADPVKQTSTVMMGKAVQIAGPSQYILPLEYQISVKISKSTRQFKLKNKRDEETSLCHN